MARRNARDKFYVWDMVREVPVEPFESLDAALEYIGEELDLAIRAPSGNWFGPAALRTVPTTYVGPPPAPEKPDDGSC